MNAFCRRDGACFGRLSSQRLRAGLPSLNGAPPSFFIPLHPKRYRGRSFPPSLDRRGARPRTSPSPHHRCKSFSSRVLHFHHVGTTFASTALDLDWRRGVFPLRSGRVHAGLLDAACGWNSDRVRRIRPWRARSRTADSTPMATRNTRTRASRTQVTAWGGRRAGAAHATGCR
jgi:hypothetical protein